MRVAIFASLAVVGIAANYSATAADLPVKAARLQPVPTSPWTGCYLGGNVGYGWGPTTWNDNGLEFTSHSADGVVGGGQIGCDYQAGAWVFGIQGMFDASGMKGHGRNLPLDPGGRVIDETKISSFATLTGRVGYTVQPDALLYLKGGAAWVRSSFNECCEPTVVLQDELGPLADGAAKITRTGWTIGVGFERMLASNWSAFVEYDYIDLGTKTVTFSPINGTPGPFNYRIDQDIHTLLVGLNYRFGAALR
jgi:outer membrane immunogenic protein